jgi:hypothetical protein
MKRAACWKLKLVPKKDIILHRNRTIPGGWYW